MFKGKISEHVCCNSQSLVVLLVWSDVQNILYLLKKYIIIISLALFFYVTILWFVNVIGSYELDVYKNWYCLQMIFRCCLILFPGTLCPNITGSECCEAMVFRKVVLEDSFNQPCPHLALLLAKIYFLFFLRSWQFVHMLYSKK